MPQLDSVDSARVALRALVDEYALASDTADLERFGSLFTLDAEFVLSTPGTAETVTLRGRDQVKYGPSGNQMFERTFHAVHNHVIAVDGDHATGLTYCTARHLLRKADDSLEVILAPIQYHDDYRLTDEGWKFSRRELEWTWIERRPAEPPAPWW
ncbi:nuclear transport factor 2 family protein [Mycobacterium hodleri]|uniref:nuclear transport factor 2 family protein n=1 Tax=Mycolicibacterium hodleri TaxID=49897 RepID=UPI0021F36F92|nr:nuclear transport factor 2 family protein [Mycolicibacterium hodleri]MCV7137044.1 nuclear transport factor 2 family protein [Mycolicibacterium hodleri]